MSEHDDRPVIDSVPEPDGSLIVQALESYHEPWMNEAACRSRGHDLFFSYKKKAIAAAKVICNEQCSVRDECLDYAVSNREAYGVWGGTDENERKILMKVWTRS